jgi:hypothetical protein
MAGTMTLGNAASKFDAAADADFIRHLTAAALDLGRVRPRTLLGSLSLAADQPDYPAPADLLQPKVALWCGAEKRRYKPWDPLYPGQLPRLSRVESGGAAELWLTPAPTAAQIAVCGATFRFYYFAGHLLSDEAGGTTVAAGDRALLLLRALAEGMRELAVSGVVNPVTLSRVMAQVPSNGTPQALTEQLLREFEREAAR